MKSKFIWPCLLFGNTYAMSGKRRTICATIDGAGDVHKAIYEYMAKRKNSHEWLGVQLTAITPLTQVVLEVFEPDTR